MISIEVTPESQNALRIKLDRGKTGIVKGLRAGIYAATIHLSTVIKRDYLSGQVVNRRTGNLSRAIFAKMESDTVGVVGVGKEAPYGRFINDGSAPHVITAVNAKALRFVVNGNTLFRKSVNHPGIKARHFMQDALKESVTRISQIINERVNRGAKGESIE